MAHELELKFEVPSARLAALAKAPWLRRLSGDEPATEKLVSVYYDTKDHALKDRDISLRVRRIGNRHVQTVKARAAGTLDRQEWEEPLGGDQPDRTLARGSALKPFADRKHWRRLRPLFETSISRTSLDVHQGDSRIALALDQGTIKANRHRQPVSEIELELKHGSISDLLALAQTIRAKVPLDLGPLSKAERGYALADGDAGCHQKASAIPLDPAMMSQEGFCAIATACLAQAAANKDAVLKQDAEGIHQMRVGLRRLRSALSLFKEMIAGAETDTIKADLKWLSEQLAPARDLDVLAEDGIKPMQACDPDNRGLVALTEDVAQRRQEAFDQARQLVESDRYRDILLRTELWAIGGQWTKDQDDLRASRRQRALCESARDILTARTRKVIKKLKKFDEMDWDKRHKLRIAVKKLRYATDFFEHLFCQHAKKRKGFAKALKRLQSALGRLNDIHVHANFAEKTIVKGPGKNRTNQAAAFGLGQLMACEKADADGCVKDAGRAGKAFSALKPYWA